MADTKTPEATPELPEPEKKKEAAPKAPKEPQQTKEEIIDEFKKSEQQEQAKKRAEELDNPESRYSRLRNYIRRPIYNVLLAGALVANPVVTGAILGTRKAADKVLGNIPVASVPYEYATRAIDSVGATAMDAVTHVVAAPALIPDTFEDIGEVITGNVRAESKGFIGRTREVVTETATGAIKKTVEALTTVVRKTLAAAGWTIDTLTEPIRTLIAGYAKALVTKPVPTILGTALVAGGIYSMGALNAAKSVFDASLAILQGLAKWLGVPVTPPVPAPVL